MRASTTIPAAMLVNGYAHLSSHLVSFRARLAELCRKFGCTSSSSWSPIVSSWETADAFSLAGADSGAGGSPLRAADAGARSRIGGRREAIGATIQYQNALMPTGASVTSTRIHSASTNTRRTEPRIRGACRLAIRAARFVATGDPPAQSRLRAADCINWHGAADPFSSGPVPRRSPSCSVVIVERPGHVPAQLRCTLPCLGSWNPDQQCVRVLVLLQLLLFRAIGVPGRKSVRSRDCTN